MIFYLLAILADILLALQFSSSKAYQNRCGNALLPSLIFTAVSSIETALLFVVINRFNIEFTLFSGILALLVGLFYCSYMLLSFKIIAQRNVSVYTMFLMLGSLVLPYLTGVLFLNEYVSFPRIIGLILLIAALILPSFQEKSADHNSKRTYIYCFLVFLFNGLIGVITKLHSHIDLPKVKTEAFVILTNTSSLIISGIIILYLVFIKKTRFEFKAEKGIILPIIFLTAYAICNGISYLLQLVGAANLPATVVFPLITGGSVVLTGVAGRIFFGQKQKGLSLLSLILAFSATVMFLF